MIRQNEREIIVCSTLYFRYHGRFCIALGYLAFIRITGTAPTEWGSFNNFLGGALFPVGLIALTFVGGELATGNMMVMTLGVLQKKVRVGALLL